MITDEADDTMFLMLVVGLMVSALPVGLGLALIWAGIGYPLWSIAWTRWRAPKRARLR